MHHCIMAKHVFSYLSSEIIWNLQDGNDLDEVKGNIVQLSDENRSHTLEESSSVHVDCRSNGQNKTADVLRYTVIFLHTLHHHRQSCRTREQGIEG